MGPQSLANRLVEPVNDLLNRVGGLVLPNEVTVRLDDDEYRFRISTRFEYEGLEKYQATPDGVALRRFAADLRPDDVVWDVGANVGVFSVVAATRCATGSVHAFEPIPENVARLDENLALNGVDADVRRLALASEAGESQIRVSTHAGTGAYGLFDNSATRRTVPVETVQGDDLVSTDCPAPTVLKVDVQGAELDVLRGLTDSLSGCRVVYCNVYEKHFETDDEGDRLHALLEDAGLEVERLGDWAGGYFVRAVATASDD